VTGGTGEVAVQVLELDKMRLQRTDDGGRAAEQEEDEDEDRDDEDEDRAA